METTCDGLLDNRVVIEQPRHGFRVAIDTVMLAAAVPAETGEAVLDLGCGAGGALLCLGARISELKLAGVEVQPELAGLCFGNLERQFPDRDIQVATAAVEDLIDHPAYDQWRNFDHILINPPYHDEARHDASPLATKRIANTGNSDLTRWFETAAQLLKPGGSLTIVHRADRQDALQHQMTPLFGGIEILPLLPKALAPAKRIIMRGYTNMDRPVRIYSSLVLHKPDGRFTPQANAVLRDAQPLVFTDIIMPQ